MNRLRRVLVPVTAVVGGAIIGILVNFLVVFITQGNNTNSNQNLLAILAGLGGVLVAVFASLAVYFQVSKEKAQQQRLLESEAHQEKERFLRLSQEGLELEKQRTDLEKRQQTLLWQLAAAEVMKDDPKLAIVSAYQGLESEIQSLIGRVYRADTEDARQEFSISYNYDLLADYIDPKEARVIVQMRDLRNRVIHGEVSPEEITEDKVRDYVQRAGRIAQDILQVGQAQET